MGCDRVSTCATSPLLILFLASKHISRSSGGSFEHSPIIFYSVVREGIPYCPFFPPLSLSQNLYPSYLLLRFSRRGLFLPMNFLYLDKVDSPLELPVPSSDGLSKVLNGWFFPPLFSFPRISSSRFLGHLPFIAFHSF